MAARHGDRSARSINSRVAVAPSAASTILPIGLVRFYFGSNPNNMSPEQIDPVRGPPWNRVSAWPRRADYCLCVLLPGRSRLATRHAQPKSLEPSAPRQATASVDRNRYTRYLREHHGNAIHGRTYSLTCKGHDVLVATVCAARGATWGPPFGRRRQSTIATC